MSERIMHFSARDSPCSPHNNAMKSCEDLLNQSIHINTTVNVQILEQVCKNCLRFKTSIDTICWLAFQVVALEAMRKHQSQVIEVTFFR